MVMAAAAEPQEVRLEAARTAAARAHRLHGGAAPVQTVPVPPTLAGLFPDGGLRCGAACSVQGSATLAMALLAGASATGAWCGVVGVPGFGAEAAAALGIDLERLVVVPDPGSAWLGVLSTLVDALTVVVVAPPSTVSDGEAGRLGARLRQRGTVLVTCGRWPGAEVRLSLRDGRWVGLGVGHGYLAGRLVTVLAEGRGTAIRPRRTRVWLPGREGELRSGDDEVATSSHPVVLREVGG